MSTKLFLILILVFCSAVVLCGSSVVANGLSNAAMLQLRAGLLEKSMGLDSNSSVEQAVTRLRSAIEWDDTDATLRKRLAWFHKLVGDNALAVPAFESAHELRPWDSAIHLDLAKAYEAIGRGEAADELWAQLGFGFQYKLSEADDHFNNYRNIEAANWYGYALRHQPDEAGQIQFRQMVAAIRAGLESGRALIERVRSHDIPVDVVDVELLAGDFVTINGGDFRWIRAYNAQASLASGTPLNYMHGGEHGPFWISGTALSLIDIKTSGQYKMQFEVRHGGPPPVIMPIAIGAEVIPSLVLEKGDNSWESYEQTVDFAAGLHAITVGFLNDAVIDGQDRNGLLAYVRIVRVG